jgi:hypothetical protein
MHCAVNGMFGHQFFVNSFLDGKFIGNEVGLIGIEETYPMIFNALCSKRINSFLIELI